MIDRDKPEKISFAILDIGGFLGLGTRRVAVEFNALRLREGDDELKIVLPGGNRKSLEKLPELVKTS